MADATTPDNITLWTNGDPASLVQESQTQGASIQVALDKRQRYDYVWANDSERNAETGMTQGSRGYQLDTKSEYIYDNSNWRLALSYGEYAQSSGQSVPNGTETSLTNLNYSTTNSTDSTFATVASNGTITLVRPGVYSLSLVVGFTNSVGATHYAALRPDTTGTLPPLSLSGFNAQSTTVALPFLRTTANNYVLYPRVYQSNGAANTTLYAILRIGRLG